MTGAAGASEKAARGAREAGAAMSAAAGGADVEAAAMTAASGAIERKVGWIGRLVAALRGVPAASAGAVAGVRGVTAAANDNAGAMKANVGNIAAQFQDIGVTAAMGMSPMMIALQQGTQLAAVFAASGQSAFKTLGGAIASVLSPTAILTIGLVALAAMGFQMVDWAGLARDALNGLAGVLETIAPYAIGAAAALALIYAPAILTGIASVVTGLWSMAAGLLAIIPIPVLIVAGLTAIVAAANYFRDDLTKILGFDIVAAAKTGINFIVGGFIGGWKAVFATWKMLPSVMGDVVFQTANWVLRGIDNMVNGSIDRINGLIAMLPAWLGGNSGGIQAKVNIGQVANPFAGAAGKMIDTAVGTIAKETGKDWVGGFVEGVQEWAEWGAGKLRGLADSIASGDAKKKGKKDKAEKAKKPMADPNRDHAEEILRKWDTPIKVDEVVLPDRPEVDKYFDNLSDAIGRAKEIARGFFDDLRSGLEQGKSIWSSFGNAVLGALNKIQNKLMDKLINSAIDNLFSAMGDSGTGGFIKKIFGSAKGNAFGSNGVQQFAKGGDFTNSIVSRPTLFKFANGGALGEMGEAGPEAVLPLQRGPDGSLGVQALGSGGGGTFAPVINIANDNRVTGAVSSQDIVELQKRASKQAKDQLTQELPEIMRQYRENGAYVSS